MLQFSVFLSTALMLVALQMIFIIAGASSTVAGFTIPSQVSREESEQQRTGKSRHRHAFKKAFVAHQTSKDGLHHVVTKPHSMRAPLAGASCEELEAELCDDDAALVDELITEIATARSDDRNFAEQVVLQNLQRMQPGLIISLQKAAESADCDEQITLVDASKDMTTKMVFLGKTVKTVLDARLASAKELLSQLMSSGEIRKLDGAIGRAAKEGKLDMAFFTVLNTNINDAYEQQKECKGAGVSSSAADNSGNDSEDRLQILRHIYTRCQEEVEKSVSPGVGLLNKLLRTEMAPVRANQLRHYLGPQKNTIKTPDGEELELKGVGNALVPPSELITALANSVAQIRKVERAGGTNSVTAANLVESCRQVAIEARLAIGELYGPNSVELRNFEEGLQPVFRPTVKEEGDVA